VLRAIAAFLFFFLGILIFNLHVVMVVVPGKKIDAAMIGTFAARDLQLKAAMNGSFAERDLQLKASYAGVLCFSASLYSCIRFSSIS